MPDSIIHCHAVSVNLSGTSPTSTSTSYTADFGNLMVTMIALLIRTISSDMVIMPLPSGLLIEYFHRLVPEILSCLDLL